ncbi:MAG: FAD-dependent oxidoreductase [Verrucomicrobiia bacterium]
MNRRDFLQLATVSSACSVFVRLDSAEAQAAPAATNPGTEQHGDGAQPVAQPGLTSGDARMAQVNLACDLFIAGGGMAGVCAALAAARHGAKVVLVQDRSRLGGNSSSEVKMHIVGADMHGQRRGWREGGLIEELRLEDAVHNPQRSREMWDLLLYDKIKSEPNVTLLLDTACCAAEVEGGMIRRVLCRCDATEQLTQVEARLFADCTGDCRLALEAGAELRRGREAKSEFGESLAVDQADAHTLGSTILFTSRKHDKAMPFRPPAWARKITKDMLRFRPISSWEYGYWWVEWGGHLDTIRDNERIRFELLSIALGVWDYIKNSGEHPSSANWAMDWIGMMPGKRGSRRIAGDHILTEQDLMGKNGDFNDAVCIGGWGLDDHPPAGFDRSDLKPFHTVPPPFPYNIPLRSLYSRTVPNLLMAGRNISASHVAFTSTRVMATCAVMGQAMGTAAAYCVHQGLLPREVAGNSAQMDRLQQVLLRDDQTIRDRRNTDPADLARRAEISASAALPSSDPAVVINGLVRDLPGTRVNAWTAELGQEPVWLQLEWTDPQELREIQITFDTGFERELTLTHQDSLNAKMVRAPQPETVRDYELLYRPPGGDEWRSLGQVTGNYQRLRRHVFPPFKASAVRLQISATNGSKTAAVYEVRCYADRVTGRA